MLIMNISQEEAIKNNIVKSFAKKQEIKKSINWAKDYDTKKFKKVNE